MPEKRRYKLEASPLYHLGRKSKLARLLGISEAELRYFTKYADKLYTEKERPKKNGKMREIQDPARPLKKVQAALARLLTRVEPPAFLFCPVKGRCYVDNAAAHRGQRVVKSLDIREYFPSTPSRRVYWFFREVMGCQRDVSAVLSQLSTYKGWLPTGSPLSPILAFYAHYDVWSRVSNFCEAYGCRLTVYIDDVTISGDHVSEELFWKVKKEIHRAGHRYHKEKAFYGVPAEITGVIVSGDDILVPHRQRMKLRHLEGLLKTATSAEEHRKIAERLRGMRAQVRQIRSKAVA
jgi:retron-type reverse transcriptase